MSTASVDVTCHGRVRHRERVERRSQLGRKRVKEWCTNTNTHKRSSPDPHPIHTIAQLIGVVYGFSTAFLQPNVHSAQLRFCIFVASLLHPEHSLPPNDCCCCCCSGMFSGEPIQLSQIGTSESRDAPNGCCCYCCRRRNAIRGKVQTDIGQNGQSGQLGCFFSCHDRIGGGVVVFHSRRSMMQATRCGGR